MKRLLITASLACFLAVPASAGEMPIGGAEPLGPETSMQPTTVVVPVDTLTGSSTETSTDVTLSVLQAVLSLLSV